MESKRRRGIKVAPAKLQHALSESGLKTQTAVAERIADDEGLVSPPRSLVNKVFRGEPVDPRSVERVAKALGVEAWTLYQSSTDPELVPTSSPAPTTDDLDTGAASTVPPNASDSHRGRWWIGATTATTIAIAVAMATLLAVLLFHFKSGSTDSTDNSTATTDAPSVPASSVEPSTVVILPFTSQQAQSTATALRNALGTQLNAYWRVVPLPSGTTKTSTDTPNPQDLLTRGPMQRVVEGRVVQQGRWLSLTLYLHSPGAMHNAWQAVLRAQPAPVQVEQLMARAAAAIASNQRLANPNRTAQEKYLSGRLHLDRAATELNVRRALTEFESALRLQPNFADAYAGLCEALVVESTRSGDIERLEEAASQCQQALTLQPGHLEARRALAYLNRKRGRLSDSITGFEAVLQVAPNHVDALMGYTEALLTRYLGGDDEPAYTRALATIQHAADLSPTYWKIPYTQARVYYYGNRLTDAIAAAEQAVALSANVFSLNNLGVYQFCAGDFQAARDAYLQARQADPKTFAGEEQLAVVYYFLRDFDAAVASFKAALDLHAQSGTADDHRLWGNYGDGLRHARHTREAAAAYIQAIALAEQAVAAGDGNPMHATGLAYYHEMLRRVDPQQPATGLADLEQLQALSANNDPFSLMYLAIIYQLRGHADEARRLREQGSAGCPGFAGSPDFDLTGAMR